MRNSLQGTPVPSITFQVNNFGQLSEIPSDQLAEALNAIHKFFDVKRFDDYKNDLDWLMNCLLRDQDAISKDSAPNIFWGYTNIIELLNVLNATFKEVQKGMGAHGN
jgi:hypothetical protein